MARKALYVFSAISLVFAFVSGLLLFLAELGTTTSWSRERVLFSVISLFVVAIPIAGTVLVRKGFSMTGLAINIVSFVLSICAFLLVLLFIAAAAAV